MFTAVLLCVDPALGRLDYDSLSDQALMEMLIDGMRNRSKKGLKDESGNFLDVSEWDCIEFSDEGRVAKVDLVNFKFTEKQFPFQFIPPQAILFVAFDCNLHGTLDTAVIPENIVQFDISINNLHGPLNFKGFPRNLETLTIAENAFCGSLVLSDLPRSLIYFDAGSNKFSGEMPLNGLPPALVGLWAHDNSLTGSINIEKLPNSIETLDLNGNKFSGDSHMRSFPDSLRLVDITGNPLSGKVVLPKISGAMKFNLEIDNFSQAVDENGDQHYWHERIAHVQFRFRVQL